MMKKLAIILGILGLGILVSLLIKGGQEVKNIDGLIVGEVVKIEGVVDSERKFGAGKLLIIEDIPVYCECDGKYSGKNVLVAGIIEKFPDDLRIRAFRVEILD